MFWTPTRIAVCAAIVFTVALPPATALLVAQLGWLFAGHALFGLTVGLMVGMTRSSVVSTVLPLLFTFAGGSIAALSIAADRTTAQLDVLGHQLVGFAIGTILGLLFGIVLQRLDVPLPLGRLRDPRTAR